MFIETVRNFISEIILAITSIGILTVLTVGISYAIKHLDILLPKLFDLFRKETRDKLTPIEEKMDALFEYIAHDAMTKSKNPTLKEYDKAKYEELAAKLLKLKEVNTTEVVVEKINVVEEAIDKVIESTSFLGE